MMIIVIIQLILRILVSESTHFYGGTLTWKPMNNTATGSTISVMFTQSYQFRRSAYSADAYNYCNQSIILDQSPLIPNSAQKKVNCTSISCANYVPISVNEYCTDFSIIRDSSSGQISTIQDIIAGSQFCVGFQDFSWITVYSTVCAGGCFSSTAGWSIVTCLDLTMRSDGFINTPPVATVISRITTITDVNTNPPLYMYKGSLIRIGMSSVWTISESWIPDSNQLGSQVYCALATDSASISSDQYCLTFFVVSPGSGLYCPNERPTTTTTTSTSTSTSSGSSTSTSSTIATTSTTASTSSPKATNKSIDPWPIIWSVIGFLALCALCCCCWWWWFLCGPGRRRRRSKQREKATDDYLLTANHRTKKFSHSLLKNLRQRTKTTNISAIELPDRSLLESRTTSMMSHESPIQILNDESFPRKSDSNVSVVKRSQKSSITDEENESRNDNNIDRSKTLTPNVEKPQSKSSIRLSDSNLLPTTKQNSLVRINKSTSRKH
ncbi:hypothetical protein I4U23_011569 [Adineta vaga]|nr:hypothetical protein I4U23_011569 [Adineta vaga]